MSKLEYREYQYYIVGRILKACGAKKNIIVELDAGMGKRVISFIFTKYLEPSKRILYITPSRTSVRDTYQFFVKMSKEVGLKGFKIGILSSEVPRYYREYILKNFNLIITTPITLANLLIKMPNLAKFDYIIINEVDKVVRRIAYVPVYDEVPEYLAKYQLVYPWQKLKLLLPKDACWIGLSGTLRDMHTVRVKEDIEFKPELETIVKVLFPTEKECEILRMEETLRKTDASKYIWSNITVIKKIPVKDDWMKKVLGALSEEIENLTKVLASKYLKTQNKTESEIRELMEKAISKLPNDDIHKIKFLRIALVRKFLIASTPQHYKKFILRPSIRRIIARKIENFSANDIPEKSTKVEKAVKIAKEWVRAGKKVAILTSYVVTALEIKKRLEEEKVKTFLLTGKTINKGRVISEFKEEKEAAILIMTPVGERDLDLPDTDLLIIHDVINTPKTMYQRFKRGRKAYVAILYYENTFEKDKVNKLLQKIKKKYPWSVIIE